MAGTPQMALTAYVTALGAAMLVPMVAYELFRSPPVIITPGTWLAALYLGAFASGLNLLLWNRALQALDASVAGNFINLVPVIGVATAALFLGEWPAPVQLVGGLLVLLGVWISSRSPSRVAAPPA
jgi:drug/metabolite transporter (DMT)-like permease